MTSTDIKLGFLENLFGLKNRIKWVTCTKIILYHLLAVWWCSKYTFPAKFITIGFALFMGIINCIGIGCGIHRLFTHKAYKVQTPLKIFLLVCFTSAGQNSPYQWIRDHRLHHKFSDTEADPHNANRGLFFSHIGWLMTFKNEEVIKNGKKVDMTDVMNDKHIMFFTRYHLLFNGLFCFVLPSLINIFLFEENWKCVIAWQWFLRFLYVFHSELSVNSFAHLHGYTPYNKEIMPKQNPYVSLATLGEGWHNYHHMFPFDYKAAEFFDFFGLSSILIKWWEAKGWAYDLKQSSPDTVEFVIKKIGEGKARLEN